MTIWAISPVNSLRLTYKRHCQHELRLDPSTQHSNTANGDSRIPCEYCEKGIPWSEYENHAVSVTKKYHPRSRLCFQHSCQAEAHRALERKNRSVYQLRSMNVWPSPLSGELIVTQDQSIPPQSGPLLQRIPIVKILRYLVCFARDQCLDLVSSFIR